MVKPIQHSAAAFLCGLIALGGSAIGYAVKDGHAPAGPSVVAQARAAESPDALAHAIGRCRVNDLEACARVAGRLEAMMAGEKTPAGDRTLAKMLARSAVLVIREQAAPVDEGRWAAVLGGLFAGRDKQLDASADRVLARRIAGRLMAVSADESHLAAN